MIDNYAKSESKIEVGGGAPLSRSKTRNNYAHEFEILTCSKKLSITATEMAQRKLNGLKVTEEFSKCFPDYNQILKQYSKSKIFSPKQAQPDSTLTQTFPIKEQERKRGG